MAAKHPDTRDRSLAPDVAAVVEGIRERRMVALARAITLVESGGIAAVGLLDALCGPSARADAVSQPRSPAHRIGITGPPGTGKSTLVARLVAHARQAAPLKPVAVVAVDPSSPFSGGALLGDRYRMAAVADDPLVFIRSMASRGALGGLSEATDGACDVIEAAGFPVIFIETVGVGQNEVAIASSCETTLVVLNPENGDSIQALKAGLLEVADIVVVNKADHPRTERFVNDLRSGMELQERQHGGLITPILATIATEDSGTSEVAAAIARHQAWLADSGQGAIRQRERTVARIRRLWLAMLRDSALSEPALAARLEAMASGVVAGSTTPWRAAEELRQHTLGGVRAP